MIARFGHLVARVDGTADIIITVDWRAGLALAIGIAGLYPGAEQVVIAITVRKAVTWRARPTTVDAVLALVLNPVVASGSAAGSHG